MTRWTAPRTSRGIPAGDSSRDSACSAATTRRTLLPPRPRRIHRPRWRRRPTRPARTGRDWTFRHCRAIWTRRRRSPRRAPNGMMPSARPRPRCRPRDRRRPRPRGRPRPPAAASSTSSAAMAIEPPAPPPGAGFLPSPGGGHLLPAPVKRESDPPLNPRLIDATPTAIRDNTVLTPPRIALSGQPTPGPS